MGIKKIRLDINTLLSGVLANGEHHYSVSDNEVPEGARIISVARQSEAYDRAGRVEVYLEHESFEDKPIGERLDYLQDISFTNLETCFNVVNEPKNIAIKEVDSIIQIIASKGEAYCPLYALSKSGRIFRATSEFYDAKSVIEWKEVSNPLNS